MSAGCVHQKASVALAGGFLLGSFAFGPGWEYAAGALVGVLLTPDLDVDNGYIGNNIIRQGLGYWGDKVWDVIWYFYRRSLKHGSELSHFPVVSTLFRLAYLYFFVIIIPYVVLHLFFPGTWGDLQWMMELGVKHYKLILGLMGSDIIHWGLDILTTEHAGQKKIMIFGVPLQSSSCK